MRLTNVPKAILLQSNTPHTRSPIPSHTHTPVLIRTWHLPCRKRKKLQKQ